MPRLLHSRPAQNGGVAGGERVRQRCDAIHWGVLDAGAGGIGTARVGSVPGQRTRYQEPAGRKSDVQECQWLLKLHTFGLLNNSFQATDQIRVARTLWRQRGNLVAAASSA